MSEERAPRATTRTRRPSPWSGRALVAVAVVAWLGIAGLALAFKQRWIDVGDGTAKPVAASAPAPRPEPVPARASRSEPGCLTSAQYEHLQRLPAYGVVKRGHAREASLKARPTQGP